MAQEVRFCRSPDGVRIAYAVHGSGPALLINSCWLSHLQYDWQSPVWRHFLDDLGRIATVIRYDERGHGLSDWQVDDFSLTARVGDLEAVVASAGFERFALLGMSQGGPVAIAYAAAHPERLTRLILFGAYAARRRSPEDDEMFEAFTSLIRVGWARPQSTFRRVFTNLLIPGADETQMQWVDALQRMSTSTENAYQFRVQRQNEDVTALLPQVTAPTLVLHALGDETVGFAEGRLIATTIPGASLVPLDSRNHILLAGEPAWPVFVRELAAFLAPDRDQAEPPDAELLNLADLTARELEILRLAAAGLDNGAIAGSLVLSVRTVERHLSNAYLKLGVSGRAGRAAAVAGLARRGLA
ncbi:alpha/beta fold hydrolase [Paractinoplanes globisporus]|uniref:Alpha/beta fold hydrolase n=1 Tax=Paractinoplanes globisporus TaxID=113565 RepID=A0ABW6W7G6_9ACTN|nr:alpha/beta fold hydrolase [Actinoplanes globisporus]